ncbi:two-component system regulatory protein YycI [Virgibacillus proomii]|jgi:regulatory protein YycI of two-component signal transduction system YycFG|uniref:two-component system regulatory protein YycI n=1 Tax=Virgibacillus proomii TaxID=84407 RepID=UPI00098557CD|nr:two-component system regulatory protein YycI [Virgibacillus proomii]
MQWSQIKTLFILCFLILNIYLFIEFMDKQNRVDSFDQASTEEPTIEEMLKQENIKVSDKHVDVTKDTYINVAPKKFTDVDIKKATDLKGQDVQLINKTLLVSRFDSPVPIPQDKTSMNELIRSYTAFANDYVFYGWDKKTNVLLFFQQKKDRPIYFNRYGTILVFLNKDNEMVYYMQTMLGDAKEQGEPSKLLNPIKAIGYLYNQNELVSEDNVTSVDNGYYTRIGSETGSNQVFAPTYKIEVNKERNYFVNAVEGYVNAGDDTKFISDTIKSNLSNFKQMNKDVDWKDDFIKMVEESIIEDSITEDIRIEE